MIPIGRPRIAIRVDASVSMGTGHIKRCISLAVALAETGGDLLFVCRALDSVAAKILETSDFEVHWLGTHGSDIESCPTKNATCARASTNVAMEQDALDTSAALSDWCPDWVVVDHYDIDARWHSVVRGALNCRLLVLDDTADRPLDADVLVDHNWNIDHKSKYANLVQRRPVWLTGPRFALISAAYRRIQHHTPGETVRSIGIFLGGTDPGAASAQALEACRRAGFDGPIEIVSTSANPRLEKLKLACDSDPTATLSLDLRDLVSFFERHDLQIGAGGGATWERCCAAVPTVGLMLAANQSASLPGLASLGAVLLARLENDTERQDLPTLSSVLKQITSDSGLRKALSQRAATLVDGRGTQRVALSVLGAGLHLRPATLEDIHLLYGWRNHASVRNASMNSSSIAYQDHAQWFRTALGDPKRLLLVGQVGEVPVGSIRFDLEANHCFEVSLYVDPELQGLGLGKHLLAAGERMLSAKNSASHSFRVDANVKQDNVASRRLFEACGYSGAPPRYSKLINQASTDWMDRS